MTSSTPANSVVSWHDVGVETDFPDGEAVAVPVNGRAVAIVRLADGWRAVQDRCTHGVGSLSQGFVSDNCIECPLHEGVFDLTTGEVRSGPPPRPLRVYPIRIVDGRVQVEG